MASGLSLLAYVAAAIASPEGAQPLDELIVFSDPARCTPGAPLSALLRVFMVQGGDGVWRRGSGAIPRRYRASVVELGWAVGSTYFLSGGARLRGTWHGIPMRGMGLTFRPPEDRSPRFELVFAASPAQVRDELEALGFVFGTHEGMTVSLERSESYTALVCRPA